MHGDLDRNSRSVLEKRNPTSNGEQTARWSGEFEPTPHTSGQLIGVPEILRSCRQRARGIGGLVRFRYFDFHLRGKGWGKE
jgi:hypothetical protein